MRRPRSTYRLQLTPRLTMYDAPAQFDYLRDLGVDALYLSPLLESGSDHGYDVVDHARTDAARGGRAGFEALAGAAHESGFAVIVDIVPNHVGVGDAPRSVWWWDVLTFGRASRHAAAFDIDWVAGGGKVLLPVLGDDGRIEFDGDRLAYYDHRFPIAPGTRRQGDDPDTVHGRQHYRLMHYRLADTELNYRRFFAVNSLAAIRVEDPAVFAGSHDEIARWVDEGWVDGLRVDHPDGLADPAGYLRALAALSGGRYTVVEKILEPGEELPTDWSCDGTTGYDALAEVERVLINPAGESALTELGTELRGETADWAELVHTAKREVTDGILGSEIRRLARLLPGDEAAWLDPLSELIANFAVYRSYSPDIDPELPAALDRARQRRPELARALGRIAEAASDPGTEFATRLQQTTGAVMAKAVEDRAFYRFPRLVSLTEVGGDPSMFATTVEEFHRAQQKRLATWPDSMTTLSTHDTKRGEDVRARIDVLAEIPDQWAGTVRAVRRELPLSDAVLANLLLQTVVGSWPIERDRLHDYAVKAAREAEVSTSWIDPDARFEAELDAFIDGIYDMPAVRARIDGLTDRIRPAGWSNSLSAKLVQLTAPGVPDVYRGTELWTNALVDPDNRRPFDPLDVAAPLLARLQSGWLPPVDVTGAVKLLVTSRALQARRDRPELFTGYRPLVAAGTAADHLIAFDRGRAVTLATRLPIGLRHRGGWGDTTVELPSGPWRDAVTGRRVRGEVTGSGGVTMPVVHLLDRYPVALLLPDGEAA